MIVKRSGTVAWTFGRTIYACEAACRADRRTRRLHPARIIADGPTVRPSTLRATPRGITWRLERKGDADRLRVLCGAICLAEQLERSRDQSVVRVELENRDSCVLVRAVTSSDPGSDTSVAIWSAQQGSDVLAAAIGKPVEVVRGEG